MIKLSSFTDVVLSLSYTNFYVISGLGENMDTDYSHWSVSPGGKVLSLNKFRLACVSGNFYYNWKTSGF